MDSVPSINLCSTDFPIGDLKAAHYAAGLTEKELQYASNMILAQNAGALVLFDQVSKESRKIHEFLKCFLTETSIEKLANPEPNSPLFYFEEFACVFYYNTGNYLGFGDTKFVPRITKDQLREIVKDNKKAAALLEECIDDIYDLSSNKTQLGFNPDGYTVYYQPDDFTADEAEGIDKVLKAAGVRIENTAIIRHADKYEVAVASIEVDKAGQKVGTFNGKDVYVTKGRSSEALKLVVKHLNEALKNTANETQTEMIKSLIEHFTTGSVAAHVKYSELWVKDVDPVVETHTGFIENYRDPKGCRCEFEGLVSCVDKQESINLHKFVEASETILKLMPYPKEYERATFNPPSYNALNILQMTSTGYPIGINIPNYDEIRLKIGFKNVTLSNVMSSVSIQKSVLDLLDPALRDVFSEYSEQVESLAVAAHELYGHGSGGKLRKADVEGGKVDDLLNPGRKVESYWPDDDTSFDQMFGACSSAYEECRAETSAVYLTFFDEVLDIFNVKKDPEVRKNFLFVTVVKMLIAGLRGMFCYSAEAKRWTQAHSAARFAILRACLMWGRGAAEIRKTAEGGYQLFVDINKLDGIKDAITTLLKHLNYYKTTCLPGPGAEFFAAMTAFDDRWIAIKKYVDAQPRKRAAYCGGVVRGEPGHYKIESLPKEKATPLDVALTFIENITLATK